jgi:site-specific recombinase XerD/transcriptional regulator with XRE-family HTH domain
VLATYASNAIVTRASTTFSSLAEAWRSQGEEGSRFVQSLSAFLANVAPETYRYYQFSILEFYDWYKENYGALMLPKQVLHDQAQRYVAYLRSRPIGIIETRLKNDASRGIDNAIFEFVRRRPGARYDEILAMLESRTDLYVETTIPLPDGRTTVERMLPADVQPGKLDRYLACLVERKVLRRSPTIEELRQQDRTMMNRLDQRVDPSIFTYHVPEIPRGMERSGTVRARVAALSSFWSFLIKSSGENTGAKALIEHNVWTLPLDRLSESASSQAEATKIKKTPDEGIFWAIFNTTKDAQGIPSQKLEDVRDRFLLLLLYHLALRANEVTQLKRLNLRPGNPPILEVTGKRSKKRFLPVPKPVMDALAELDNKLAELAEHAEKQNPGVISRPGRLLEGDAPLVPAVSRWGCASASPRASYEDGITRQAIAMMLRRRAERAGIGHKSVDFAKVHPHGIRHMTATKAMLEGTPVNVVQALLGHTNMATTGRYVKVLDPTLLVLHPESPPAAAPAAAAPVAAPPPAAPAPARVPTYKPAPTPAPAPAPAQAPVAPARPRRPEVIETTATVTYEDVPFVPAPVEERVVAVGEKPPIDRPTPSTVAVERAEAAAAAAFASAATPEIRKGAQTVDLSDVYKADFWGEQGDRKALHAKKATDVEGEEDLLTQVYVGNQSRLPWFVGTSGKLIPAMPVFWKGQLCVTDSTLAPELSDLWTRWVADPKRGPTAARAMLDWMTYGLEVGEQVFNYCIKEHPGSLWVPFDGTPPTEWSLREHLDAMIVRWFDVRGWSYARTEGKESEKRTAKPSDASNAPPAWYMSADPIAELPDSERYEALDFLRSITQAVPLGSKKLFRRRGEPDDRTPSLSRADVWTFLLAFASYDQAKDDLSEAIRTGSADASYLKALEKALNQASENARIKLAELYLSRGAVNLALRNVTAGSKPASWQLPTTRRQLTRWRKSLNLSVEDLAKKLGMPLADVQDDESDAKLSPAVQSKLTGLPRELGAAMWIDADVPSVRELREQRVQKGKEAETSTGKEKSLERVRRSKAYLQMIGDLLGPTAENDPVLQRFEFRPREGSLAEKGVEFKDFFHVGDNTILHSPEFRRSFAQATGLSSECVARRVARSLWEMQKSGSRKLGKYKAELASLVDTMMSHKYPCDAEQETQLRDDLGERLSFEDARFKACERLSQETGEDVADVLSRAEAGLEFREAAGEDVFETGQYTENPGRTYAYYARNASQRVPSPVLLWAWANVAST